MSGDNEKKSNKFLIIIIAVLTAVIIGLIVFIAVGGKDKNKKNKNTENTTGEPAVEQEEKTDVDVNSTDTEENNTEASADCYITISRSNGWESGEKYSGQFDVKIINESEKNLKNWTIKLDVPEGTTVDNFWNGNCEIKDGELVINPAEYNGEIAAGATVADIGFIVTVPSEADIKIISENARLYIDGKEYSGTDSAGEADAKDSEDKASEEASDSKKPSEPESGTPFDNHGKLSVDGTDIVDSKGDKYQLKGVSTHGIAWFPDYVNKDAFATFRDDWNANLIRIAMYTHENNGYCTDGNKQQLKELVDTGVEAATELGMYVIIDWHVLREENPQTYKEEAKAFFEEMSAKYKDYDNVIYEICNEPNGGTTWDDVKSYAEEVIPVIRENAPDAIIIVGTPNWSQDVDIASQEPIEGYDNIMYAVHFYAATHTDNIRNKVTTAIGNGLPVFVSEFSICDASGNGAVDYGQADKWFELINDNNLSYAGWNISNKDETSSLIKSSCTKTSGWTEDELSETGIWLRNMIKGK